MVTYTKFKFANFKFSRAILLIGITCCLQVKSQTDADNHRKYWYFKSRLNNDFLKVGTAAGESIPFTQRCMGAISNTHEHGSFGLGDGTGTHGYYIAILATEYYLLSQSGQNTDKVRHELFCALNTINRLDMAAEVQNGAAPQLNGFLVKDDTPDFYTGANKQAYYEHFNYFNNGDPNWYNNPSVNNLNRGFMSQFNHGERNISSGWIGWTNDNSNKNPCSQDDRHDLLFGLMMVKKFVPQHETDNNTVFPYDPANVTSLLDEAKNITRRLVDNLRQPKKIDGSDCMPNWWTVGWKVKDPVNCNNASLGFNAQTYAYALAEMERIILDNYSAPTFNMSLSSFNTSTNPYGNGYSGGAGFHAWNAAANTLYPTSPWPFNGQNFYDQRHFVRTEMATCNCAYGMVPNTVVSYWTTYLKKVPVLNWIGYVVGWIWQHVWTVTNTLIAGFYYNTSQSSINGQSYVTNCPADHAPLARKVLWGGAYTPNPEHSFNYLLDVMPCDNEFNFGNGTWGSFQWSSTDRIVHPEQVGSSSLTRGEYPALDYLLYHNLWYIHQLQKGNPVYIKDLSDVRINQCCGTFNQANNNNFNGNVNAYETISCETTNLTYTTGNSYWRAGKYIHLKPGTEFTGINNVRLYIDHFTCATNTGQYRAANNEDNVGGFYDIDTSGAAQAFQNFQYPTDVVTETEKLTSKVKEDKHFQNLVSENATNASREKNPNIIRDILVKPSVTYETTKVFFQLSEGEKAFVNLTDLSGNIVFQKTAFGNESIGFEIDLTSITKGMYLLKFTTTKGFSATKKIIKQ